MEILEEIAKQSPLLALCGGIIWWLLSDRKALRNELKDAHIYILEQSKEGKEREKEIGDEKREDLEATLKIVQGQTEAVKSQTDAMRELSNQIRYDRK